MSKCTSALLYSDISDHLPIILKCRINSAPIDNTINKPAMQYRRYFGQAAMHNFSNYLKLIDWTHLYELEDAIDPNTCFDMFIDKFLTGFNICFPLTKISNFKRRTRKEWMTAG